MHQRMYKRLRVVQERWNPEEKLLRAELVECYASKGDLSICKDYLIVLGVHHLDLNKVISIPVVEIAVTVYHNFVFLEHFSILQLDVAVDY